MLKQSSRRKCNACFPMLEYIYEKDQHEHVHTLPQENQSQLQHVAVIDSMTMVYMRTY